MENTIVQFITAFIGSLSFSFVFNQRRSIMLVASMGSICCFGSYLVGTYYYEGELFPCLLASAVAALYAEVLARVMKAPATLFLVPAILPVIPGSKLYYAMSNVVRKDWYQARVYGFSAVESAIAIAIGISLVWACSVMIQNISKNRKNVVEK